MSEKKVITKPVDYVVLNHLSKDFETRFIPQTELSAEQAYWSRLPALQDDLILSVIEQLKTQVVNSTKINQYNKHVNEILTAELESYKNQERILKEQNNDDKASVACAQSMEIETLKHTLSKHLKEKESLEQKVTLLKNDFQKEESRNIDRELALEKQLYDGSVIKKSDAIVIHDSEETLLLADESHLKMLKKQNHPKMSEKKVITKPVDYVVLNHLSKDFETRFIPQTELSAEQAYWSRFFYDHSTKQALGFQNPFYLKKAQHLEPKLYDGNVIKNTYAIMIPDSEETLMLAEESRSKMILKQQDPIILEKKVNIKPIDYVVLIQLYQDFKNDLFHKLNYLLNKPFGLRIL
uniref:Uncharacterized protein n=1 Tax=Tanacetum cinerariifolium TaxID=118510 RepID=A0A699L946_TANCI|nr:hypothetical protein [Tanacetum cinerariifolium]